ncbi:MAG TPA: hypothetical protein DCL29_02095 [Eubacterium sp.]|nr:hypothetical protein [Eubacterium sp.]
MAKDNYSKMRSFMAKHAPEKLSVKDLKEDSEARYEQKTKEDARLLELYNQKKLTNKNTIRKAKAIADKYNK